MNTNRSVVFFIIILLVVGLSACTRPVPQPENTAEPAPPTEAVVPGPTDMIDIINQNATQTAFAQITPGEPPGAVETQPAPTLPGEIPAETPMGGEPTAEQPVVPATVEPTAAPPAIPAVIPTISVPASYTLNTGEYPYCIARRFDVDPGELLRVNGLSNSSVYYAGMTLSIPKTGRQFPGNRSLNSHPTTYTVRPGDTIYSIACYFGDVAPEGIVAANGLTAPYKLSTGQVLNIP